MIKNDLIQLILYIKEKGEPRPTSSIHVITSGIVNILTVVPY